MESSVSRPAQAEELLAKLGFESFRPGQREAVEAALAGRDSLIVMPTGGGKSLCYQLPGLATEDLTIVVSPLIALINDQWRRLTAAGHPVAMVTSAMEWEDVRRTLAEVASGQARMVYCSPERFGSEAFQQAIGRRRVDLLAVDEAHCVSEWGHDFRPDYFRLADAARYVGAGSLVASTATATPQVANDIAQRLGLRDPVRVATGFDRPNLSFGVIPCASAQAKHRHIASALKEADATPAIVYAGTRKGAEKLATHLSGNLDGAVAAYHAGLGREQRADVQRRFMDGRLDIVVATNAFGMGIDKANVRTVCHESVPGSIEAYYQEAGRAGRDGRPARALLFAEGRDKGLHVFFIQRGELSDQAIATVAMRLQARAHEGRYDLGADELSAVLDGDTRDNDDTVRAVIGHLARAGVIRPAPSSPDRIRGRIAGPFDGRARAACRTSAGESTRARWSQYRNVWRFVESDACRRTAILRHFDDRSSPVPMEGVPCCDVCDPAWVPAAPAAKSSRRRPAGAPPVAPGDLDAAIAEVVETADPAVGRTRTVEILRGGRSAALVKSGHDGLPAYGTFDHLTAKQVMARIDELQRAGRLRSTGGTYPKLVVAAPQLETAA